MICFILPAYNEGENIGAVMDSICREMDGLASSYRIIVVDDGSTDDTVRKVRAHPAFEQVAVVSHPLNRGVAAAFASGLARAAELCGGNDVVFIIEGDNTSSISRIPEMIRGIEEGGDIVIASRYARGGAYVGFPVGRLMYSWCANRLMALLFGIEGVRDYTIFFRAYRSGLIREALLRYGGSLITTRGFVANAELLIKLSRLGAKVREVPFVYRYDRKAGASKMNVPGNVFEYARFVLREKFGRKRGRPGSGG